MRACPHPCKGYQPVRGAQEVPLTRGEWWRGEVCPGSVAFGDPVVTAVLRDFQVMDKWGAMSLREWNEQPAWWCAGIREVQQMHDAIDAEQVQPE